MVLLCFNKNKELLDSDRVSIPLVLFYFILISWLQEAYSWITLKSKAIKLSWLKDMNYELSK